MPTATHVQTKFDYGASDLLRSDEDFRQRVDSTFKRAGSGARESSGGWDEAELQYPSSDGACTLCYCYCDGSRAR